MNDRQELLDQMRQVRQEQSVMIGPREDELITQRAHKVRLYYKALMEEGFDELEALQLTMTCTF